MGDGRAGKKSYSFAKSTSIMSVSRLGGGRCPYVSMASVGSGGKEPKESTERSKQRLT